MTKVIVEINSDKGNVGQHVLVEGDDPIQLTGITSRKIMAYHILGADADAILYGDGGIYKKFPSGESKTTTFGEYSVRVEHE